MLNIQLASKYGTAIFEIARDEKKLDNYEKELLRIQKDFFSIPEVNNFFHSPFVPDQSKRELIIKVFENKISAMVMNFLMVLIDRKRIAIFDEIVNVFSSLKDKEQGILVAEVITTSPLSILQREKLIEKLESLTHKKIKIRTHEDVSILGGIVIKIGDKRVDGSVLGRLNMFQSAMYN